MKTRKNVVILLVCFALVTIVFAGCNSNSKIKQNGMEKSTKESKKVSIPRIHSFEKQKSVEIELPEIALSGINGANKEDRMEEFLYNLQEQGVYFEDVYLNDMGTIVLLCNEEQYNAYLNFLESQINGAMDTGIVVTINDEFTHICYIITGECTMTEYAMLAFRMEGYSAMTQTVLGTPSKQWKVTHSLYYEDSDVVMLEYEFGAGISYEITNEEWQQKMEEAKELAEGDD
ncbi:MAG: hypothetical protein E7257_04905 [Lachnospiraceae bacterium]|nr:hypothetical protein [Lachnospiraceae bacterium]